MGKTEMREACAMRMLEARGRMTVGEAVDVLKVSESTARRLFAALEKDGRAIRSYGGIHLPAAADGYSFERYEKLLDPEKRRIGIRAAGMVESGDSLYLDCGTTLLRMAEALNRRVEDGELVSLNIVTNSIENVGALAGALSCRVILLGGEYNHARRDFSGPITEKCLEMFRFKKCFLGSEGMTAKVGFSTNHLGLSSLDSKVIARSDATVVLMDSSKFGRDALVAYAALKDANAIVTDELTDAALAAEIRRRDVRLVTADGQSRSNGRKEMEP